MVSEGIQKALDAYGAGWQVARYVVVVGAERCTEDQAETTTWLFNPPQQAGYITNGLLHRGHELADLEIDEDQGTTDPD